MAERSTPNASPPGAAPPPASPDPTSPALPPLGAAKPQGWRQAWQLPVLLVGVLMLVSWVFVYRGSNSPKIDYAGSMDSITQSLQAEDVDNARDRINRLLPHIKNAPPVEQARLKLLWGDLIYLTQKAQGGSVRENHERVVSLYSEAQETGVPLDSGRLRRLADTYIAMGREDDAVRTVGRIKGWNVSTMPSTRKRRNRGMAVT